MLFCIYLQLVGVVSDEKLLELLELANVSRHCKDGEKFQRIDGLRS
jgi:hypothetical protein